MIFRNISRLLKQVFLLVAAWISVQFCNLTKEKALWMSVMRKSILIVLCGQVPSNRHKKKAVMIETSGSKLDLDFKWK